VVGHGGVPGPIPEGGQELFEVLRLHRQGEFVGRVGIGKVFGVHPNGKSTIGAERQVCQRRVGPLLGGLLGLLGIGQIQRTVTVGLFVIGGALLFFCFLLVAQGHLADQTGPLVTGLFVFYFLYVCHGQTIGRAPCRER